MSKVCTVCNNEKDLISFHKRGNGYRSQCKKCINELRKDYHKNYRKEKSEDIRHRQILYRKNNPEKKKESYRKWLENNPNYYKEYQNNRLRSDILFKISRSIRVRISKSINRQKFKKNNKTKEILGCSFEEFKIYLESKFEPWMNWRNRGLYNGELNHGWDLDHIIPVSTAKTEEEIMELNHYTNFQPLCSKINRDIKKNNINYE